MNKIKPKYGDIQQNKKKICKPVSHRENSKRKKRNTGIHFVVNVSSSGTNLHKKIQDEMTKLENVERKIRTGKTKVKEICTSRVSTEKTSNDHKLKQIFEEMLDEFAPVKKLPKKRNHKLKEPEVLNVKPKKQEKVKKFVQTSIKVVSLTDLNLKDKFVSQKNRDTIKLTSPLKNSTLKKPKTAPSTKRHDSLVKDLKFAECLNFRKDIDLHLSISDMKQFVVSCHTKNDKVVTDACDDGRINLENDSQEEKYIGDELMFKEYVKSNKPDRKRFYSSLTRGNFPISEHYNDKIVHKEAMKDPDNLEPITVIEAMKEQPNIFSVSSGDEKDLHKNTLEVKLKDRLEAVENVLGNGNSITFPSMNNLKDKTFHNLNSRSQINRSVSHLEFHNSMKEIVVLKTPVQSFIASEETVKYQNMYVQHLEDNTDFECNHDENLEFFDIALNSSKRISISKESAVYFASNQSKERTSRICSSKVDLNISQRLLRNPNIFIDDLSKTCFKTKQSTSSNELFDEDHKKMENNFHLPEIFSQYSDVKSSDICPEYNIEKCLSLLRKKFRDFENTRHKNFDEKNSLESKAQKRDNSDKVVIQKSSQWCKMKGADEDYEVCFKNENFINQSEISLESFNKIDEEILSFKSLKTTEYEANSNLEMKK